MDLIRRFQAGHLAKRLQDPLQAADGVAQTQEKLLALGPSAVRGLLDAIARGKASTASNEVLERLCTNDTLSVFVEALQSPVPAVVEAASVALSRSALYDPAQLLGLFSEPAVSKARLESILAAQMQRIQPVTLVRVLPDLSKDARGSVFRLLERRADSSISADVVGLARHAEWWLRLHAVKLLAKMPGKDSITGVAELLKDESAAVRLEAVRTLGVLRATEVLPALCGRLRDIDIKVQAAAIETLISLGDVSAVPHLLEYLRDESEYVRRAAVEVLNQVVTTEAIKDLVSALRDADWWVRVRAADALGTLGGPKVIDAVIDLVGDPDDFIRRYAVEILNTVPDKRAVEPLIRALDDHDWWVRERAIDALAKTRDPRAVEPLLRMLSRDTRAVPLCLRALAQIPDPRVVESVCRLVDSDSAEIRREAINALTQFTKSELPDESRNRVHDALERAGVGNKRSTPSMPLEVRGHFGPESGRSDSGLRRVSGRESDSAGAVPSGTPAPSPVSPAHQRVLNFQKLEPGTMVNERFKVVRYIGGGGFGTVYLVEDTVVHEDLVLKILSPQLSLDESMIRRFVQELRLTRRISHRNVIRIYDMVDLGGAHAISMEHFDGRDLGQVAREDGPMSVERAVAIVHQVLDGLEAAHAMGIVHRDIKPANILVDANDVVKIVDFGLALVSQGTRSRLTQSGILVGTPEYISPEQITGQEVDGRTDLYSLGIVLYEMISGRGSAAVRGRTARPGVGERRGHALHVEARRRPARERGRGPRAPAPRRGLIRARPWPASTRSSRSASSRAVRTSTSPSACRPSCASMASCCRFPTASSRTRNRRRWSPRSWASTRSSTSTGSVPSTSPTTPRASGASGSTHAASGAASRRSAASSRTACPGSSSSACRACSRRSAGSARGSYSSPAPPERASPRRSPR
jgi:serine/threonine-protein kinase